MGPRWRLPKFAIRSRFWRRCELERTSRSDYAEFHGRTHDAIIRVYDETGNMIETRSRPEVRKLLSRRRPPAFGGWYSPYLGAVAGACFVGCWSEPFPITTASAPNGGAAFAGKSGRNTANACETNAMETTMITAAYLMVGALIRFRPHDK